MILKNTLSYKGYNGTVECSEEDDCLFGHVIGIKNSKISYEGQTFRELVDGFHYMVDVYLDDCKAKGIEPEVPYKGSFNIRISPELHKNIAVYAINHNISLNKAIADALQKEFT
ncbi:MAG: type II toxin-antitoxin system HicB family antitoxin [Clostridiales bacterium]|nr:type II toxin-antitoxin system HicB family antitoxin [Clostridiales bacterium]